MNSILSTVFWKSTPHLASCGRSAHAAGSWMSEPIANPPKWQWVQGCMGWKKHEKEKKWSHYIHFCDLVWVHHITFLACISFHYEAISWNIIPLLVPLIEHFTLFRIFGSICKGREKKNFICAMKWESEASSCKQAALLSQIYTLILSVELIPFFTSQEKIRFTLMRSNLCTIPTHFLCFQPCPSGKFLWEINMGIGS